MTIRFEQDKATKRCIRFEEVMDDILDTPVIEHLYVKKEALKKLGWSEGQPLFVTLETEE